MKGKKIFTTQEINELRQLIKLRNKADQSKQKSIRAKMRRLGFYGRDDFGIIDLTPQAFETLLKSGRIKTTKSIDNKITKQTHNKTVPRPIQVVNNQIDGKFKLYDPLSNDETSIPDESGNYIICLKQGSKLPKVKVNFETLKHANLKVIYVGIAGKSLRKRDYRQHFNGNAGSSTLRKSIGSLFGYKKIPRSKHLDDGKTKFSPQDESTLSQWMHKNLILFYLINPNPNALEDLLIRKYNPPLNLSKNHCEINKKYRSNLSILRRI